MQLCFFQVGTTTWTQKEEVSNARKQVYSGTFALFESMVADTYCMDALSSSLVQVLVYSSYHPMCLVL